VAVALAAVVVLAAGLEGTSHFHGARWFPKLGGHESYGTRTLISLAPVHMRPGVRVPHHGTSLPWWVGAIVVVLLALALAFGLWRWWGAHRLPAAPLSPRPAVAATQALAAPEPEPEPEALLSGIALALSVLDEQREPGDAVVRAWLGLEQTAEESGIVRRPSETPTEFTSRILRGAFAEDAALRTLLRLYLRSRFGDHPVTAADVSEVRDALQQLLASWRPAGATPAGGARPR
jgi:hypothetical protein